MPKEPEKLSDELPVDVEEVTRVAERLRDLAENLRDKMIKGGGKLPPDQQKQTEEKIKRLMGQWDYAFGKPHTPPGEIAPPNNPPRPRRRE